jgi:hypothetical protein
MTKDEPTVVLKLKDPVLNIEEEPLKNNERVKEKMKDDGRGNKIPKTPEEMEKEAPNLLRGELLSGMLINGCKPKDKEQAAKIKRLATKIRNVTLKGKGDWEINENELKELEELFSLVPINTPDANMTIGEIQIMLEEAKKALFLKQQEKN